MSQAPTMAQMFNDNLPGSDDNPNTLRMFGFDLMSWDEKAQKIRVAFQTRLEFRNPAGAIQGGIVAAMLDDAFGPLLIIASGRTQAPLTLDLNISYVAAATHGRFECEARIIRRGKSIAFVEGELFGEDGELVARATSTVRLVPLGPRS